MTVAERIGVDQLPTGVGESVRRLLGAAVPSVAPAVSVAVLVGGRLVYEAGFGRIGPHHADAPVTPDHRFDLASVTKVFTATCFLSLASADRVGLDDPLVSIVPEFGSRAPRGIDGGQDPFTRTMQPAPPERVGWRVDPAQVTFRQLLAHTSGLAPWRSVFEMAGPVPPPPGESDPRPLDARWLAAVEAICGFPFVDLPGRAIHYSDLGFMLLGEVARRLTGVPFERALREHVTEPLGLGGTTFRPIAAGVALDGVVPTSVDGLWRMRRSWGEPEDENAAGLGGVAGHAGLFAPARDVAALGQAWLDRDPRLGINQMLLDEALQAQASEPGIRRGLGWSLRPDGRSDQEEPSPLEPLGERSFGHTGFTGTSVSVDPQRGLVVALLTNRVHAGRFNDGIGELRRGLSALLAGALG